MIYIANDVESAGSKLGVHSTLSWGACVITRDAIDFQDYFDRGLVFYAELKPENWNFEMQSIKVGCAQLVGLKSRDFNGEIYPSLSCFDVNSASFNPILVLDQMSQRGEHPVVAVNRFHGWIEKIKKEFKDEKVIGVTDTVFFDGGRVDLLLSQHSDRPSPFGHKGLDLDSIYRGYSSRADASLKKLCFLDQRTKPHRADHDAVYLAQVARELLFNRMGW